MSELGSESLSEEKTKAEVEIFSAFQQFLKLLSDVHHSEERSKQINDSILADLLGEPPEPNAQSLVSQSIVELMHRFLELQQTAHRFPTILKMVGRHPWGTDIEKSQHLENCYHLLCNECYILEERLKRYFEAANACAVECGFSSIPKPIPKEILGTHKKVLGRFVAMRGRHVHQTNLIPREISRVGLIETFMKTDFLQDQMPILHRLALNDARRTWRDNARTMSAAASILIARALRSTEYIWRPAIETALQIQKSAEKLDRP